MRAQPAPWTIPLADGPVRPWVDRTVAGVVAVVATTCAGALWRATPDPRGHGTHEQLGLDVCGWPLVYGVPCPTCGCTTAACLLVHGRVLDAFVVQPFGAAVAAAGLLAGLHAVACLWRGRSFLDLLVRLPFWRLAAGSLLLLLLSWGYKYATWTA